MSSRAVFNNAKQETFKLFKKLFSMFLGGRGTGKTTLSGDNSYEKVLKLPRSKGFFLGLTYHQVLNRYLPAITDRWTQLGLKEYINPRIPGHYIIGKRPPDSWVKPYKAARDYSHVISFVNGSCIEMISFDRPNQSRSGNYDWGQVDEAQLIPKERFDKELKLAVRDNKNRFEGNPLHHSIDFYATMPWTFSGFWVLEFEQMMQDDPDMFYYLESVTRDNVDVLGESYLINCEKTLPYLIYQIECNNKRFRKPPNSFYPSLNEEKHYYFKSFSYDQNDAGLWVTTDSDIAGSLPFDSSWDFNASFCSMILAQEHTKDNEARIFDNIYENNLSSADADQSIIERLCIKFINKYASHPKKVIFIWGDRNGNNKIANSTETFYQFIQRKLEGAGWSVILMVKGLDPGHQEKYAVIDNILAGGNPNAVKVRINKNKCKELIVSMENTPITPEFKKDKSSEKADIPQQNATHLSDCFDNYIYPKYGQSVKHGNASEEVFFL
jgi:hypothetical protein